MRSVRTASLLALFLAFTGVIGAPVTGTLTATVTAMDALPNQAPPGSAAQPTAGTRPRGGRLFHGGAPWDYGCCHQVSPSLDEVRTHRAGRQWSDLRVAGLPAAIHVGKEPSVSRPHPILAGSIAAGAAIALLTGCGP
jgi:hypothetical protein